MEAFDPQLVALGATIARKFRASCIHVHRVRNARASPAEGRFADHVEGGQPAGDARGIIAARKAIYWVDLANRGRPTHVTLVWRIDGREVQRQNLIVGRAPHWRTWGGRKVDGAREIDVQVLDATGRSLKADSLTLDG